jgi:5'-nucleotidase
VAAAAEAAVFFGVPSMAVSLDIGEEMDYARAGRIARRIFDRYAAATIRPGVCLNVNIPVLKPGWPLGVRVCPQCLIPAEAWYEREDTGDGPRTYSLQYDPPEACGDAESDADLVLSGYVTITPLRFDLADRAMLADMRGWEWPKDLS